MFTYKTHLELVAALQHLRLHRHDLVVNLIARNHKPLKLSKQGEQGRA